MSTREATIERNTTETQIVLTLNIDGTGKSDITTGIPFFDHMLTLLARHALMDLHIRATGDIEVDYHHTVEDVGIVLGQAMRQALGDKKGIERYGWCLLPMDETLARVAVDLSGVNKWYGDFHVLRDINLTVNKGERIVICGPSG